MVAVSTIALVDLVLGGVAGAGLLYLLYAETVVVHYRRFFRLITFGMLVYAVTGPVVGTLAPAYIHLVHGTAALCIAVGLYDLVQEDLSRDDAFEAVFGLEAQPPPASTTSDGVGEQVDAED